MTKLLYLGREIIDNKINSTTKFQTHANIERQENFLTIDYTENLPGKAICRVCYDGKDSIIIERSCDQLYNRLLITKCKLIPNDYITLSGTAELVTFGKEISLVVLEDQSEVLKFNYDLYQGNQLLNSHKIYLQIRN